MLNRAATQGLLGRHPRCDTVLVTHLSFADDILVFTDGSPSSLRATMGVFEEFSRISGLNINATKSAIFLGGRDQQPQMEVASEIGLQI